MQVSDPRYKIQLSLALDENYAPRKKELGAAYLDIALQIIGLGGVKGCHRS